MIESQQKFDKVRWRATLSSIFSKLTKQENSLTSLDEILSITNTKSFKDVGVQTILVKDIIGSEGRYDEFDKNFLPLRSELRDRWAKIDELHETQVSLPPIKVYQVESFYFVQDGHHRVSVAKARKQEFIDALVLKCDTEVTITGNLNGKERFLLQEQSNFQKKTQLSQRIPGAEIRMTFPDSYQILLQIIEQYIKVNNQQMEPKMTFHEGVDSWYNNVFLPFAEEVYYHDVLNSFPNRTTGDLYIWTQLRWDDLKENKAPSTSEKPSKARGLKKEKEQFFKILNLQGNEKLQPYMGIYMASVLMSITSSGVIKVAVVRRKYHPFESQWSLPIRMLGKDETRQNCAQRCFQNALGIEKALKIVHFKTFDGLNHSPWGRLIVFGMLAVYYGDDLHLCAGGIASEIKLIDIGDPLELVYEHNQIVEEAFEYLHRIRNNFAFIKELFPDDITLKHIRQLLREIRKLRKATGKDY